MIELELFGINCYLYFVRETKKSKYGWVFVRPVSYSYEDLEALDHKFLKESFVNTIGFDDEAPRIHFLSLCITDWDKMIDFLFPEALEESLQLLFETQNEPFNDYLCKNSSIKPSQFTIIWKVYDGHHLSCFGVGELFLNETKYAYCRLSFEHEIPRAFGKKPLCSFYSAIKKATEKEVIKEKRVISKENNPEAVERSRNAIKGYTHAFKIFKNRLKK